MAISYYWCCNTCLFASGKKVGTTVFVGFCTFFIGFLHPVFWSKAIETTSIMLISIFLCVTLEFL